MKVNKYQRLVLIAAGAAITLMLAFPPFHTVFKKRMTSNDGYSFILDPPDPGRSSINVETLVIQWVGVLLIGGIAFVVAKDKE